MGATSWTEDQTPWKATTAAWGERGNGKFLTVQCRFFHCEISFPIAFVFRKTSMFSFPINFIDVLYHILIYLFDRYGKFRTHPDSDCSVLWYQFWLFWSPTSVVGMLILSFIISPGRADQSTTGRARWREEFRRTLWKEREILKK